MPAARNVQRSSRFLLKKRQKTAFEFVVENDEFLALWPHRYDYLYAPHPDPDQKPDWQTETAHPLGDRLLLQGSYLYGVRLGPKTAYGMLDVDAGSPYHPRRDPLALERMFAALEPLGLVSHLTVNSSSNGGLHVYLPFGEEVLSWQLALAIAALLENAGFKIMPGWLEVFPNRKPYVAQGTPSLYNGHRLPLQQGSYLLDESLCPVLASARHGAHVFTRRWQQVAERNDVCLETLEQIVKTAKRKAFRVSGKAEKFLNDLNAEIEPGWSGRGQTNYLLGRITMRSYIFGHILTAPAPLTGEALVADIVKVAKALPGYRDFCGHQADIESRARDWARKIESDGHYYHYCNRKAVRQEGELGWNDLQQLKARERVQNAAVALLRQNNWPEKATHRYKLLCAAGISGATLYKHKDLWHPEHMAVPKALRIEQTIEDAVKGDVVSEPVKIPPNPPAIRTEGAGLSANGAALTPYGPSLLGGVGCNALSDGSSGTRKPINDQTAEGGGCNVSSSGQESEFEAVPPPRQLVLEIRQQLATISARQTARAVVEQGQQETRSATDNAAVRSQRRAAHIEKLRQWEASDDPILKTEALRQMRYLGIT